MDRASYYVALEGVTRFGLAEAVKAILRNALGHPFFPAPPELRGQCDKTMKPHEDYRERMARRRKIAEEYAAHRPVQARTPEQIARVQRVLADFHASYEKTADAFTPTLDPELVAQVKDNPKARERVGMQEQ